MTRWPRWASRNGRVRSYAAAQPGRSTAHPALDLVNRNLGAAGPNGLWVADATRIPCGQGVFWLDRFFMEIRCIHIRYLSRHPEHSGHYWDASLFPTSSARRSRSSADRRAMYSSGISLSSCHPRKVQSMPHRRIKLHNPRSLLSTAAESGPFWDLLNRTPIVWLTLSSRWSWRLRKPSKGRRDSAREDGL